MRTLQHAIVREHPVDDFDVYLVTESLSNQRHVSSFRNLETAFIAASALNHALARDNRLSDEVDPAFLPGADISVTRLAAQRNPRLSPRTERFTS